MRTLYKQKKSHIFFCYLLVALCICLNCSYFQTANGDIGSITNPTENTWNDASYSIRPAGSGLETDPFLIQQPEHLAYFIQNPWNLNGRYLSVQANIDLSDHYWEPINGVGYETHISGNGYTIKGLKIQATAIAAMFGDFSSLTIDGLNFVDVDVYSNSYAAAVIGYSGGTSNISNVTVRGKIVSTGNYYAAGIAAYGGNGIIENCINYASVTAQEKANGITGYAGIIRNCNNYGDVTALGNDGWACGIADISTYIYDCNVECTIMSMIAYGITYQTIVKVSNCSFRGKIISNAPNGYSSGGSYFVSTIGGGVITNCFGIAEILLTATSDTTAVNPLGGGYNNSVSTIKNSYNYCDVTTMASEKNIRMYQIDKTGLASESFADWAVSPYINGGFPFPVGMFAIGGFLPAQNVEAYLQSYGFGIPVEIKTLSKSTYGADKYVEFGKYPQTYVGSSMNTTLEGWYSGKSVVDTYTVDNGTYATSNVYNAYVYTDGNTYVRVPTPIPFNTNYTYANGTIVTTSATWFKVEPIKWLILNYTDYKNGAAPVVIAEQGLTANVPWNKTTAGQNIWSETSNIRTWLNGTFYNDAFGLGDTGNIVDTILQNNSQSSQNDGTGTSTTDKVWLLSKDEAYGTSGSGKYFTTNAQRCVSPTDFALANGCYLDINTSYSTTARPNGGTCSYLLRSAYPSNNYLTCVVNDHGAQDGYYVSHTYIVVRPALTLNANFMI